MASEVEFKGKTVEQAVEIACQHLDIIPDKLKYDIVSRGKTGIFGLVGVKKAHIKVYLKENQDDSPADEDPQAPESGSQPEEQIGEAALAGKAALERIANGITGGARVLTKEDQKRIAYRITGGKAGVLIGKRGQTLEAIQYLVEKIVNRQSKPRVRVSIDVGGYLEKKKKNLEGLAARTAQKAKKNGKPATVGQLNAHDRRIVHMALKDDTDVTTKSVGNGFLRKLVVLPKKRQAGRRGRPV